MRGWEGEKNDKKNMYAKSCLNSRQDPDRCHASPDYPTELFSISKRDQGSWGQRDHGDRLFEVNSTNSFKNLSPRSIAENVTSGKFIKRHGLVSPNSVKSAIPALIDKGLLTQDKGIYKVYDLFFALWLIKNF